MKNFKRILLVMVALIVTAGAANAKIINFGVKAGLNVNKLHFSKKAMEDLVDPGNSTGWEAGVMAEFNVPVIGLCFDAAVMYARMNNAVGDILDENGTSVIDEGKLYGQNFIEIPINLKYKFIFPAVSNIVKPMIFTGPTFAFKLDKEIFDNFKTRTCQVAWNIGIGAELFNHLQIGASYGFGINNIAKWTSAETGIHTSDLKINNNYWTVTAAYLF